MRYSWLGALALFLFVTIFFQKSGMTGWLISALSFVGFLALYIMYGDDAKDEEVKSEDKDDKEKEEEKEEDSSVSKLTTSLDEGAVVENKEEPKEVEDVGIKMTAHFAIDPKIFLTACYKNDIAKVTELLEDGFNIDVSNHQGVTAFMFAVKGKAYDVVNYLIENEVDVTRVTEKGTTALKIAQENGDEEMINILNG
ncbi:ankyrin repeat domain-containing protein [bacterium]|nr:ankyrin repeat domain-containing protein [bacterium]